MPRSAFTLLELLVVVAIIALLAALGLGAYSRAVTARNQTESLARLRQWGVALGSYVGEHDGDLPRRGQGVQPVTQFDRPEDWFNALPPYLGQPGYGTLLTRANRPRAGERSLFVRPGARDPGGQAFLSYAMNMNLSPWNLASPTRLVQIERPSLTVFLAESPGPYASTYPSSRDFGCLAPHSGQGNILFLDGHAGSFTAEYLGVGQGDPQRDDVRWLTGTASGLPGRQLPMNAPTPPGPPPTTTTRRAFLRQASCGALGTAALALGAAACHRPAPKLPPTAGVPGEIRVAVIGGMTMTGMWPELAAEFTAETGRPTRLIITGPKAVLMAALQRGEVDLLTMHSSDETTNLVANGFASNLRPWARNEHTIVGPAEDPAGIRGMKDGAEALRKIAAAQAPFVDFYGPGSRELTHKLWQRAGLKPEGDWVLKDESSTPQEIVAFAAQKHAYVVVGRIPVTQGKMALGAMEVMVQGDPEMRRPYVVVEANPSHFPQANHDGARALADWLVGEPGQAFLMAYGRRSPGGIPLYYPISAPAEAAR